MKRFDAVFIDFYGTICAGDKEAVDRACLRIVESFQLDMTPQRLAIVWGEQFFQIIERSNHDDFRSLHECELISLRNTLQPIVGDFDPEPYVAPLEEYWRSPELHTEVIDVLSQITLPVCCVSNADTEPLHAAIGRHRLQFDAVICSQSSRCYKPDSSIFRRAADALAVAPNRVIHIGDSLHSDIGGASRLGITTAWIRRAERIHDIGSAKADHTLDTLHDLLPILQAH